MIPSLCSFWLPSFSHFQSRDPFRQIQSCVHLRRGVCVILCDLPVFKNSPHFHRSRNPLSCWGVAFLRSPSHSGTHTETHRDCPETRAIRTGLQRMLIHWGIFGVIILIRKKICWYLRVKLLLASKGQTASAAFVELFCLLIWKEKLHIHQYPAVSICRGGFPP